jgi:hypothetical protein
MVTQTPVAPPAKPGSFQTYVYVSFELTFPLYFYMFRWSQLRCLLFTKGAPLRKHLRPLADRIFGQNLLVALLVPLALLMLLLILVVLPVPIALLVLLVRVFRLKPTKMIKS